MSLRERDPKVVNTIPRLLVIGSLALGLLAASTEEHSGKAPAIRITSPKDGTCYLLQASSETKVIVTIEITDVGGSGLETDDMGTPKFYEPDDNVDLFRSNIVAKGSYLNHLGQTVTQLIAEIPSRDLKIEKDSKVTPPFDAGGLTDAQRQRGFDVPPEAMVDVATFHFRIRDRAGEISIADGENMRLFIGLATALYRPPVDNVLSDDAAKRGAEAAAKKAHQAGTPAKPPAP
jgi:hypothetical protein